MCCEQTLSGSVVIVGVGSDLGGFMLVCGCGGALGWWDAFDGHSVAIKGDNIAFVE